MAVLLSFEIQESPLAPKQRYEGAIFEET